MAKRLIPFAIGAALLISGCVSNATKGFVGRPIEDLYMAWGAPVGQFDLPNGERAFQYRWGGGSMVLPGNSQTTAYTIGNMTHLQTTGMPAQVINSPGCLVTFVGAPSGSSYVIRAVQHPNDLMC